jgi:hypothetical protein
VARVKKILLTPYPGCVVVVRTRREHDRQYRRMFGKSYTGDAKLGLTTHRPGECEFLVFARSASSLAHEFGHVLLDLFEHIKSNPIEGNGEPFCYMLSHLMDEARG